MASSLPSLLHGRHLSPSSSLRLQLSHCSLTPAAGNPVPPRHLLDANTAGHTEPPWRPSLLPLLLPPAGRQLRPRRRRPSLVVDAALRALPVRRNVEPCGQSMRLNPDSFRTER
uniref:Uncharacterized protein n=1 Tax=Zea mays TaxID=4577 RepID=A0A804N448_MAIZE